MSAPEFSRPVDVRQADGRTLVLEASAPERAALARRFGLVAIERLRAELTLAREGGEVAVSGGLDARVVQPCAVSGEDLAQTIAEPLAVRFVPARGGAAADEIELDASNCDEIEFDGTHFDLGEAVAQSLALAIDPFATGPEADAARRAAGIVGEAEAGPFAALARLRKM